MKADRESGRGIPPVRRHGSLKFQVPAEPRLENLADNGAS